MATDPNDPTTTEDENQPTAGVDRVQEVSKKSDGTPDQSDGFEVIPADEPDDEPEAEKPRRRRKAEPETTAER